MHRFTARHFTVRSSIVRTVLVALVTLTCLSGIAAAQKGVDYTNPENPWDHVGQLHNELLDDAVVARQDIGDSQAALTAAMLDRAAAFTTAVTGSSCSLDNARLDIAAFIVAHPDHANERVASVLNDEQRAYFEMIDELASRLADDPTSTLADFRALEAEIAATLSEEDAAPLLAGAAVGRYSYGYWTAQVAAGDLSPWFSGLGGVDERLIPKWLKADLKGAVAGAAGGIGGGGIGILIGGLVGGGAASLIEVIDSEL